MAQPTRNVFAIVLKNFVNSLKPRKTSKHLAGVDRFGTKYFEIPADPQGGKRKPSRWFEPIDKDEFEQEMPAEWEAWLRGRRTEPPTEEELAKNLAIMQAKKLNAAALELKFLKTDGADSDVLKPEAKGARSFPTYEEYESKPGEAKRK